MPIGKITKKNIWNDGKGCFIGIDNGKSDYLCRFVPKENIGDLVDAKEGEPSRDGKPTIISIKAIKEEVADEDKPLSKKIPYRSHNYPQWQQEKDEKRQKLRLECVRIAATMVKWENDLFKLADKIEEYVRR